MNWLLKFFEKRKQDRIRILNVRPEKTRLRDWRSNALLVTASQKLAEDETYRAQLSVLRNEHPCRTMIPLGATETDRVAHQSEIAGFEKALAILESFAVLRKERSSIHATFEAEPEK